MNIRKVSFSAFSLIEVSISLLIIGILSGIWGNQLKMINKIQSSQKTQTNIDFTVKALAAYCIAEDFKLPYPSKLNSDLGKQSESMKNSFGIIPFKSLGIMEKFAKDGNGRWLLYKMNPNFCNLNSQNSNLDVKEFSSDIAGDKVAFIIKSQNSAGVDETTVWYSEKTFISNFMNIKPIINNTKEEREIPESEDVTESW